MPDAPTPGEKAYAAYLAALRPDVATWTPPPYAALDAANQAAWEAAAQAVAEDAITNLLEVQRLLAAAKEETHG